MELNDKQWKIFDFVKIKHRNQVRKYTGEPYFIHLLKVAEILSLYDVESEEIEIGLCHDILEKTSCSKQELALELIAIGYELFPRSRILKGVYDLTDIYTETKFPDYPREQRKQMEAERMLDIEPFSQTVKYAEIIDNLPWLLSHNEEAGRRYVDDVSLYLYHMNEGNAFLYQDCCDLLKKCKENLSMAGNGPG